MQRASLATLAERPYDVLVIGGGIYGAMTARDAALRGFRTALVERGDFGAGTSHNSMKVMHGGIRYVQHLDFARLRASARERAFWQRCAGEYVQPLEFLMPLVGYGMRGPVAFGAAAMLYNAAAAGLRGPHFPPVRVLGPKAARRRLGELAPSGLTGGGLWSDGQIRDANRLQMACVSAAAANGCDVANHVEATRFVTHEGRVIGARVVDRITSAEAELRAAVIVSCTGSEASRLAREASPRIPADRFPRFARAMNLVTARPAPETGLGFVSRSQSDAVVDRGGRLYFLTPWQGRTIIGTHEAPPAEAARPGEPGVEAEIAAFLAEIDAACPALGVTRREVVYCHSGLIPADIDDAAGRVHRQNRGTLIDHRARDGVPGLVTAIGIKYTTARQIAERAVDLAAAQLPTQVRPSRSLHTPLPSVGGGALDPADTDALDRRVREAVRDELALTLEDVVVRRMPLAETGALAGPDGARCLERIAQTAGAALGWDADRVAAEIAALGGRLRAAGAAPGT